MNAYLLAEVCQFVFDGAGVPRGWRLLQDLVAWRKEVVQVRQKATVAEEVKSVHRFEGHEALGRQYGRIIQLARGYGQDLVLICVDIKPDEALGPRTITS